MIWEIPFNLFKSIKSNYAIKNAQNGKNYLTLFLYEVKYYLILTVTDSVIFFAVVIELRSL